MGGRHAGFIRCRPPLTLMPQAPPHLAAVKFAHGCPVLCPGIIDCRMIASFIRACSQSEKPGHEVKDTGGADKAASSAKVLRGKPTFPPQVRPPADVAGDMGGIRDQPKPATQHAMRASALLTVTRSCIGTLCSEPSCTHFQDPIRPDDTEDRGRPRVSTARVKLLHSAARVKILNRSIWSKPEITYCP